MAFSSTFYPLLFSFYLVTRYLDLSARVYAPWRYAPVTVCSVEFELRPTGGVAALCADKIAFDRG